VRRTRFSLVLVLLLLGGTETAHALVERSAPAEYEGVEAFAPGSLSRALLPWLVSAAFALGLGALIAEALGRAQRRCGRLVPLWAIASLPLLVFAVQEYAEYWAGHGRISWTLAGAWPFLAGLALQVPFALAALLAARLLLGFANAIAVRVAQPSQLRKKAARAPRLPRDQALPSVSIHAAHRLTRGPPLPSRF
jgi:hypothetical protein